MPNIKINLIIRLQHWMDSVPGQTFLNYAYSWGASVVILGALFKLTHLPGGNLMLFIGMGTEVVVFFLSAFDRPFDRTEIGKELPKTYLTDEEIAERLEAEQERAEEDSPEQEAYHASEEPSEPTATPAYQPAQPAAGAPVAPSAPAGSQVGPVSPQVGPASQQSAPVSPQVGPAGAQVQPAAEQPQEGGTTAPAAAPQTDLPAQQLATIIRQANDELLHRAQAVLSPEMEAATKEYIEKLQALNETLARVDEQNLRLTRDSEEMENLNRTLTGINKVYELHLKSISLQVGTIDEINEQTKMLAGQIQRLNQVYGRIIEAMTVNMPGAGGGAAATNGVAQ